LDPRKEKTRRRVRCLHIWMYLDVFGSIISVQSKNINATSLVWNIVFRTCSMSNQKEAPKNRSDNARRRFCTASWALDCLWPWEIWEIGSICVQTVQTPQILTKWIQHNVDQWLKKKSHRHFA
jgi:hypothetical protein